MERLTAINSTVMTSTVEKQRIDWAWAAGLFEGEGSIVIYQQRANTINPPPKSVILALAMTDQDVVNRFVAIVGYGNAHPEKLREPYKQSWRWQTGCKREVKRILESFLPLLGDRRREKALEAIELCVYSPTYEDGRRK